MAQPYTDFGDPTESRRINTGTHAKLMGQTPPGDVADIQKKMRINPGGYTPPVGGVKPNIRVAPPMPPIQQFPQRVDPYEWAKIAGAQAQRRQMPPGPSWPYGRRNPFVGPPIRVAPPQPPADIVPPGIQTASGYAPGKPRIGPISGMTEPPISLPGYQGMAMLNSLLGI